MNNKIKEKIAKLLALAESPNENEAKVALLKARELMVQYKLRPEDCSAKKENVVKRVLDDIKCTTMTDFWIYKLSDVIAKHYFCKSYCIKPPRSKSLTLVLMGFESDVEIAERILRYAIDCVKVEQRNIYRMKKWQGYGTTDLRLACNAYGDGFVGGLDQEYQRQDAEHQEWGLVMMTPKDVQDAYGKMSMKTSKTHTRRAGSWANDIRDKGVEHGRSFKPDQRLNNTAIAQ